MKSAAALAYSWMLDILEINLIHRKDLVSLLKARSVGIRVWYHLATHTEIQCHNVLMCKKWVSSTTRMNASKNTHLGYKDSQLWRLAASDVEAQLRPWRFLQHDGTREELGELIVVVRLMNPLKMEKEKEKLTMHYQNDGMISSMSLILHSHLLYQVIRQSTFGFIRKCLLIFLCPFI